MYRRLAQEYGFTPNEVAEMTLYQKYVLLSPNNDIGQARAGRRVFKTMADYMKSKNDRQRNNSTSSR